MTFDTPQQTDYILNLLDHRRDQVNDGMRKLEDTFTDMVALHQSKRYKQLEQERDMNGTLTIRAMDEKRKLEKEVRIFSN